MEQGWGHREGYVGGDNADGGHVKLYYQCWCPPEEARSVIVAVHGVGGHSGLYTEVAQWLAAHGHAIFAPDLRGHGRSGGLRGHADDWGQIRGDIGRFVAWVQEEEPDLPLFLYAHSMGTIVGLDYVLHRPEGIRGLIISAAPLGEFDVSSFVVAAGRVASQIWPRMKLNSGAGNLDIHDATRVEEVVTRYLADPMNIRVATVRLADEFLRTIDYINEHAGDLHLPLLMIHGGEDEISPIEPAHRFFEGVASEDKHWDVYPGVYHQVHWGPDRIRILDDIRGWIVQHGG
jgi:alpha-beta hydrolase superfamily lysophospholipase